jgi:predicted lipoprotein with Yx(FWY)xxD motif
MPRRRTALAAGLAIALAAAGVAAAAAVTRHSSQSPAASRASAGRVLLHKTKVGSVLATSSGRTLYLFMGDKHGRSACYGQCAAYWPPLLRQGKLRAGAGVKPKLLGTTKRKNGTRQVTYKGHPLYLFKLDTGAGQTSGQGQRDFGAKWYVVSPAGKADKKSAPSPNNSTSTTTTSNTTTTDPYGGYP